MSDRTRLIGPAEDAGPKTKRGRHQTLRPHCQITGRGRGGLQARETETGKKKRISITRRTVKEEETPLRANFSAGDPEEDESAIRV